MNNLYKYNQNNKATVCVGKNCVKVYGDTARIVNGIVIVITVFIGLAILAKVLR